MNINTLRVPYPSVTLALRLQFPAWDHSVNIKDSASGGKFS